MKNLALYRKYRPHDFTDVYGQETIARILKNQVTTGHIGHAYLFSGIRGTGKTSIAKIFARAVNCENPVDGNPCGECATCLALNNPSNMDIIEIDAASNRGVDEIRELRETISYPPNIGKYKVYIIDETHMLTKEAFNALLKTLEEPPEHAIFILATTEPAKLPSTILSRCQQYAIKPITYEKIQERLEEISQKENVLIEDNALAEIAKRSGHSMRDALSLLDQCIDLRLPGEQISEEDVSSFLGISSKGQIIEIVDAILSENSSKLLELLNESRKAGKEDSMLLEDLVDFFKKFLYFKIANEESPDFNDYFHEIKDLVTPDEVYQIIDRLLEAHSKLRYNTLSFIVTDTALLGLSTRSQTYSKVDQEPIKRAVPKPRVKQESKPIPKSTSASEKIETMVQEPPVLPNYDEEIPIPEPTFENEEISYPETPVVDIQNEPVKKQVQKKEKVTSSSGASKNDKPDMVAFKQNLINAARQKDESLLSMLFENSEFRYNKHGLFILIEDSHQFMFHTSGFQEKVQSLVNQIFGHPVNVYPKLKSKYYERFGKQNNQQVSIETPPNESPEASPQSIEDQVRNIVGDPNLNYEVID